MCDCELYKITANYKCLIRVKHLVELGRVVPEEL